MSINEPAISGDVCGLEAKKTADAFFARASESSLEIGRLSRCSQLSLDNKHY